MKTHSLKVILLVLIITIPFGLKLSESFKTPLLNRVERDGFSKKPKDSLWEYVKNEFNHGRIDLNVNYKEKYKDPILFTLEDATSKDSIVVNEFLKELKDIFPSKEVTYFIDFTGEPFIKEKQRNPNLEKINQHDDDLISYTTQFSFGHLPAYSGTTSSAFNLGDVYLKNFEFRKNKWNTYLFDNELKFGIPEETNEEVRKKFIRHHFFKSMWETHTVKVENPNPDYRKSINRLEQYRKPSTNLVDTDYLADNEFLIKKIFSNDFKNQFEDYIYTTYPWRYANLFLDKEASKQNATAIVIFIGLLILILACSLFWNTKFKASFWNYFWAIFIFSAGSSSLMSLYEYLIYIEHSTNAVVGLLLSSLSNVLIIMVISFLFWQLEKRIVPKQGSFGYQLLIKLGLTFIFLYFPYILMVFFSDAIVANGGKINRSINDLQFLFITIGLTLGRGILIYLNHFSESLVKEKDVELSRLKEANAQSELKLLQSHINPHFLYNALNSIAGLAHTNADKTEKMALSLSDLFRYSINKKGQKMSTVSEEVTMVQNYLNIEKIRFGNRLTFSLSIEESLKDEKIPMYILQPLVENAIKHGISKIGGKAKIGLEIKREAQNLLIIVSDNGPDFPKGLVSGHGLQTVHDLLRLSYGDKATIQWENTPQKHIVISISKTA